MPFCAMMPGGQRARRARAPCRALCLFTFAPEGRIEGSCHAKEPSRHATSAGECAPLPRAPRALRVTAYAMPRAMPCMPCHMRKKERKRPTMKENHAARRAPCALSMSEHIIRLRERAGRDVAAPTPRATARHAKEIERRREGEGRGKRQEEESAMMHGSRMPCCCV